MPKGKKYSKHNPPASKVMTKNKTKPVRYTNNGKMSYSGGKKK